MRDHDEGHASVSGLTPISVSTWQEFLMHERIQEGLLRRLHEAAEKQRQLRIAHLPRAHAERVRRLTAY